MLPKKAQNVVKIQYLQYPDCKNYEGNKVCLYRSTTIEKLVDQQILDPHFTNNKDCLAPFARFEPTENGWKTALALAKFLLLE